MGRTKETETRVNKKNKVIMEWKIFFPVVLVLLAVYYLFHFVNDKMKRKPKKVREREIKFVTKEVEGYTEEVSEIAAEEEEDTSEKKSPLTNQGYNLTELYSRAREGAFQATAAIDFD